MKARVGLPQLRQRGIVHGRADGVLYRMADHGQRSAAKLGRFEIPVGYKFFRCPLR